MDDDDTAGAAFGRFWYDLVVGDDWRVAVGVVVAIGATALLSQGDASAWWVMPGRGGRSNLRPRACEQRQEGWQTQQTPGEEQNPGDAD